MLYSSFNLEYDSSTTQTISFIGNITDQTAIKTITVTINESPYCTIYPLPGVHTYNVGDIIPISCVPNENYSFLNYLINGVLISDQVTYIKADKNYNITAITISDNINNLINNE